MRSISIDLSMKYQKRFDIQGFGFYIYQYPADLVAYVVPNGDTTALRPLGIQRLIRYDEKFQYFDIITDSIHAGEQLKMYVIEDLTEFETLPTQDLNIAFNIAETGIAKESTLSSIDSKVATEATLSSIDTKIVYVNTNDAICRELAKVIAEDSYILSVYGDSDKDFIIENPIGSGKTIFIDNIEILNAGTTTPSGSPLVTVIPYLNSTYSGSPITLTVFNKTFGSTKSSVINALDISGLTITNGTKITEVYFIHEE